MINSFHIQDTNCCSQWHRLMNARASFDQDSDFCSPRNVPFTRLFTYIFHKETTREVKKGDESCTEEGRSITRCYYGYCGGLRDSANVNEMSHEPCVMQLLQVQTTHKSKSSPEEKRSCAYR